MSGRSQRGGSGGSARGGSRSTSAAVEMQAALLASSGLDTVGTEDMLKILTYTFARTKKQIVLKPDGRKCRLCPFTDDTWCPCGIANERVKRFLQFGKPPNDDGTTSSNYCCFCTRYHGSQIKKSRAQGLSITEYERQLGEDPKRLELHCIKITLSVRALIEKGGRLNSHVDWCMVEHRSLQIHHKRSMIKKKPGYKHLEMSFYVESHGDLATNGMLSKGHRLWTLDGIRGVLVPDDPVTYLEFTEEISTLMSQNVGSTEGPDGLSLGDLENLHQSIGASLRHETSGGAGAAVDRMLENASSGAKDETKGSDDTEMRSFHHLAQCITGGATGVSSENREDLSAKPIADGDVGDAGDGAPRRARRASRRLPAGSPPVPAHGAAPKRLPGGSPPGIGGGGGVPPPPANPADAQAAQKAGRGRPKRDWEEEVGKEVASFSASTQTDQLWWGSEAKTKGKHLSNFDRDIKQRIRNSTDMTEVSQLNLLSKKLFVMSAFVEVISAHGLGSPEFKHIYDLQVSTMALEPVADMALPNFIVWSRRSMDIGESDEISVWTRRTSSAQLKSSGVVNVFDEQVRLWAEKLAAYLREDDCRKRLQELYAIESEHDLEDCLFCFALLCFALLALLCFALLCFALLCFALLCL